MPTFRKLHTKIIDSFDFAEMPDDFTRVFWLLLIVAADSEGRMIGNYAWLRSRMYPLRSDVKDEQIEATLAWLVDRGMIVRYTVEGRGYFYVVKFKSYQTGTEREAKSVLPAVQELVMSNSRVSQEQVKPAASASVYESVSVSEPEILNTEGKVINFQAEMLGVLSDVTKLDYKIKRNAGRLAKPSKELLDAGYLPEQVKTFYSLGNWWYANDWRGQKGQPPTPEQILETIAQAASGVRANGSGKRAEPAGYAAIREYMEEQKNGIE